MSDPGSRLRIVYTPASLAGDGEPAVDYRRWRDLVAGGRTLPADALAELRHGCWLGGEKWLRGGYLATSGLRAGASHPELLMLNVPGAFVPWAQSLLTDIGEHVLDSDAQLLDGEMILLEDPRAAGMVLAFQRLFPGELSAPDLESETVLVLPLP